MIPSTFDSESIKSIYKWAAMILPNWDEEYKDRLAKEFGLDLKTKYSKLSDGGYGRKGKILYHLYAHN